jgi:enoyl-CoA hydratase
MKDLYRTVVYEKAQRIANIQLNRPGVLNAINLAMLTEIERALDDAEADEEIHVIVLTGAGDKSFGAGADVREMLNLDPRRARDYSLAGQRCARHIQELPKPVIAKINGLCLGGGQEMALACDFRIASDTAKFGQPEIRLGLIPGNGGTQRLARLVGKAKAMEITMLGDQIDAYEAHRLGLVHMVVSASELDTAVGKFASRLASNSPIAISTMKLALNKGLDMTLDSALWYEAECFASVFAAEDAREGMMAFIEKRHPEFKGK